MNRHMLLPGFDNAPPPPPPLLSAFPGSGHVMNNGEFVAEEGSSSSLYNFNLPALGAYTAPRTAILPPPAVPSAPPAPASSLGLGVELLSLDAPHPSQVEPLPQPRPSPGPSLPPVEVEVLNMPLPPPGTELTTCCQPPLAPRQPPPPPPPPLPAGVEPGSLVDAKHAALESSRRFEGLRSVHISVALLQDFMRMAAINTQRSIETCGVLAASLDPRTGVFTINTLLVPKQKGSSDMVEMFGEEEVFMEQDSRGLYPLGWIHTHPSQTCFLSSIDVHTQARGAAVGRWGAQPPEPTRLLLPLAVWLPDAAGRVGGDRDGPEGQQQAVRHLPADDPGWVGPDPAVHLARVPHTPGHGHWAGGVRSDQPRLPQPLDPARGH